MRREGYELSVGKPIVIEKEIDGVKCEPVEELVIDVPTAQMGAVMEIVGARKGETLHVEPRGPVDDAPCLQDDEPGAHRSPRPRPDRDAGRGDHAPHTQRVRAGLDRAFRRPAGVIIATESGQVTPHAVGLAHDRGVLFVKPGDPSTAARSSASTTGPTTSRSTSSARRSSTTCAPQAKTRR